MSMQLRAREFCICFLIFSICHCEFIPVGPCLFGWKVTCPDPHINFYLYTRKNQNSSQQVWPNESNITKSYFQPLKPNKVIIHGYNSGMNLTQLVNMKDGIQISYLHTGDFNVWMVDWSTVASGPCYPVVVSNLNYVGLCIAQMINEITKLSTFQKDKLYHFIGFSMGAHLAAYTTNHLRPYKIDRITGLDPALPLFVTSNLDRKLDKTDAHFVDVLHTDALIEGKVEQCGHIDFYMNGGLKQPGCKSSNIFDTLRCNHHRAPAYFAESITTNVGFYGWPCKGFIAYLRNKCKPVTPAVLMGENCNRNITGYHIVHTAAQYPYALGPNFVPLNKTHLQFANSSSNNGNNITVVINTDTDLESISDLKRELLNRLLFYNVINEYPEDNYNYYQTLNITTFV